MNSLQKLPFMKWTVSATARTRSVGPALRDDVGSFERSPKKT